MSGEAEMQQGHTAPDGGAQENVEGAQNQTGPVQRSDEVVKGGHDYSPELLKIYYDRLFPYALMFRWLSYGNDPANESPLVDRNFFKCREFSFTLEDDVYVRYRCFATKDEFKAAVQKRCPTKIDIGAVFNVAPSMHTSVSSFTPVERELVFDIDMTDYDPVRTCCKGTSICRLCWPFMTAAIKVLDTALREDFGFQHVLWVYSGRRGVHCWVCDENARKLSNDCRALIVRSLCWKAEEEKTKLHELPCIKRAIDILTPYFIDIMIEKQGLFQEEALLEALMSLIPDPAVREGLRDTWADNMNREDRDKWKDVKTAIRRARKNDTSKDAYKWDDVALEIVLFFVYPRLDVNVSKQMNHLLKSPFAVHPGTGRVCVPIDPAQCDDFDPEAVPTVAQLQDELNKLESVPPSRAYEATSLRPYVKLFSNFVSTIEADVTARRKGLQEPTMDF